MGQGQHRTAFSVTVHYQLGLSTWSPDFNLWTALLGMVWTVNRTTMSLFFQLTGLNCFYLKCIQSVQANFLFYWMKICVCIYINLVCEEGSPCAWRGVRSVHQVRPFYVPASLVSSEAWCYTWVCYAGSSLKMKTCLSQLQYFASSLFSAEQKICTGPVQCYRLLLFHCSLSAGNGVLLMGSRSTNSLPLGYFHLACISEGVMTVERAPFSCTLSPFR